MQCTEELNFSRDEYHNQKKRMRNVMDDSEKKLFNWYSSQNNPHKKKLRETTQYQEVFTCPWKLPRKDQMTLLYRIQKNWILRIEVPRLSSKIAMQNNDVKSDRVVKSMVSLDANETEVIKIIKLMRNRKSSGHDGIDNKILKCCPPVIDTVIAKVLNRCL